MVRFLSVGFNLPAPFAARPTLTIALPTALSLCSSPVFSVYRAALLRHSKISLSASPPAMPSRLSCKHRSSLTTLGITATCRPEGNWPLASPARRGGAEIDEEAFTFSIELRERWSAQVQASRNCGPAQGMALNRICAFWPAFPSVLATENHCPSRAFVRTQPLWSTTVSDFSFDRRTETSSLPPSIATK